MWFYYFVILVFELFFFYRKFDGFWESLNGIVFFIKNFLSCNFMDVFVGVIEVFWKFLVSSY